MSNWRIDVAKTDTNKDKDVAAESEIPKDAAEAATLGDGTKPAQAAQQVELDASGAVECYSNFCRLSSTPEELIMDLGLNPNPYAVTPDSPIRVTQRTIMNYYTAKRLLSALSMAIQRHEQAFGVLETDVRKRVKQPVTAK